MNLASLSKSYLEKATKHLKILPILEKEEAYSNVVRESQEIVELAVKGMLRAVGLDPPKHHDVSPMLLEYKDRFTAEIQSKLDRVVVISKRLRKERELSFYGDADFIPTEEYGKEDAQEAISEATFVVSVAKSVIQG